MKINCILRDLGRNYPKLPFSPISSVLIVNSPILQHNKRKVDTKNGWMRSKDKPRMSLNVLRCNNVMS